MSPNLIEAHSFLTALDEGSDAWLFQTFADGNNADKALTRLFHGSLNEHADTLAELNKAGAGVFVTINETRGCRRKKADITRIRALYVDLDGSPIEPVRATATPPQILVQSSPGRFHAYWRVVDCPVDACEPALKRLIARFDGDRNCSDRSRVLRLPGFYHRKREPYLVHMVDTAPGEYRMSDLNITDLPTSDLQKIQKNQRNQRSSSDSSDSSVGGIITRYLPDAAGQRNRCLFGLARHLKGIMPQATRADLRAILEEWHRRARPVIGTAEFSESWGDFQRGWDAVRTPFGSVLKGIMEDLELATDIPERIADLGYQEKGYLLIRICKQLQAAAGDGPIFLSARQAGELIGVHFTDASKYLHALVADGILELVKRGAGKQASRYRYVLRE